MTAPHQAFSYLFEPVLTPGERATIVLSMARTAYETFVKQAGETPDWDALPAETKNQWALAVRASFRVMLSLVAEIAGTEGTTR